MDKLNDTLAELKIDKLKIDPSVHKCLKKVLKTMDDFYLLFTDNDLSDLSLLEQEFDKLYAQKQHIIKELCNANSDNKVLKLTASLKSVNASFEQVVDKMLASLVINTYKEVNGKAIEALKDLHDKYDLT